YGADFRIALRGAGGLQAGRSDGLDRARRRRLKRCGARVCRRRRVSGKLAALASRRTVSVLPMLRPARRLFPALPLFFAVGIAQADDAPGPSCPLGVIKCPKRPVDWSMCHKNDLMDTYVMGLPTEGDRGSVNATADANSVSSTDAQHYVFEGEVKFLRYDQ